MAKRSFSETERQCGVSPGAWEEGKQVPQQGQRCWEVEENHQGGWTGDAGGQREKRRSEEQWGPWAAVRVWLFPSEVGGTGEL